MGKFLVSVADVRGYDVTTQDQLFMAKALIQSGIEVTLGSTPVRGGRGNALQYIYFHTNEMKVSVMDTQWNLDFLALNSGKLIQTGENLYTEETCVLVAGVATVLGTPIAVSGSTIYGWVTMPTGLVEKVTFTGKVASAIAGATTETVCVRYYHTSATARSVTIPANMIPKQIRLEMDVQVADSASSANIVGKVQVIVPTCIASGAFTLDLKPDGVSQTPLNLTALATTVTVSGACSNEPVYFYIIEDITSTSIFEGIRALAIEGGDFQLDASPVTTKTLTVWAVPSSGNRAAFIVSNSVLDFTSSAPSFATAGLHTGLCTGVAAGVTNISVTPTATAYQNLDAGVVCTVIP
jgi:hypothetical protein